MSLVKLRQTSVGLCSNSLLENHPLEPRTPLESGKFHYFNPSLLLTVPPNPKVTSFIAKYALHNVLKNRTPTKEESNLAVVFLNTLT